MARPKSVWGIDIGQCALKALKLREVDGQVQVEAFELIEHPKILSQPDADRRQLIGQALSQFLERANVAGCHVVISVPGQSSFSRFVKLPPVEPKRVPDIVRFEAEQQIPFPINEVIWRWQMFRDPDSPDVEVGIFAMKRSDVAEMLSHFAAVDLRIDTVQMAPLALYNFLAHDGQMSQDGATLLADVGAEKTDLVVSDKGRIWTRTIQIGGNNFTEALVRTFKLSFEKAEALKRSAASSKYARQVFQAMRPVFADLVQEIQRSIGYYTSLHRDTRFTRLLGLGNGFKLPGLQKFIEQNLNVSVARIDSYNSLAPAPSANLLSLNENVLSFAVAYGLAVQGLQLAEVATNLLPGEILRQRLWGKKRPWFIGAAAVLLAALFCPGYRAHVDSQTVSNESRLTVAQNIQKELRARNSEYERVKRLIGDEVQQIRHYTEMFAYRDFWPSVLEIVERSVEAVAADQKKLTAYGRLLQLSQTHYDTLTETDSNQLQDSQLAGLAGLLLDDTSHKRLNSTVKSAPVASLRKMAADLIADANDPLDPNSLGATSEADLRKQVQRLLLVQKVNEAKAFKDATPRNTRKVITLERLQANYLLDVARETSGGGRAGAGTAGAARPGFRVELTGRTPIPRDQANPILADMRRFSRELSRWFGSVNIVADTVEWLPMTSDHQVGVGRRPGASVAGGPRMPDPLMTDEDMADDSRFKIVWLFEITHNGIVMIDVAHGKKYRLSEEIELFADQDPGKDVFEAVKRIKKLAPGSTITIGSDPSSDKKIKVTTPWYRVAAADPEGKGVGAGWVSGAALAALADKTEQNKLEMVE